MQKSENILKALSEKQKDLDIRLQDYLTKIYYEAQKNDAERHRIKSSFLGDLFKNKEESFKGWHNLLHS